MNGALLRALPTPGTSGAQVRRAVEEVLREERFAGVEPSWVQRAFSWVTDRLLWLLSLLTSGAPGQIASAVLFALVVAAAVVAVAVYVRRIHRSGGRGRAVEGRSGVRTPQQWRELAARAAADGEAREAVRCHYRALVAEFAAAGWLEEIPGRTSGQYLAAVRADVPAAADAFTDATALFDRVWYGRVAAAPADVQRIDHLARQAVARGRGRLVAA